jgi:hypothetical protein
MRFAALLLLLCAHAVSAAEASGRNWRIAVQSLECQGNGLLVLGARVHYRGPDGAVEAPVVQIIDASGNLYRPTSVSSAKPLAQWLSAGGLSNLKAGDLGAVQFKFPVHTASGALQLEFGDIRAFALSRNACKALLSPDQLKTPRAVQRASSKENLTVYRDRYPCAPGRSVAAEYPPYLPSQLLVFGRGYLPNARAIDLPMGRAPAQSYAYAGLDELKHIEDAARRALAADFPEYRPATYFAFNWGVQRSQSANELYSIGVYELRPCPG